MRCASLYVELPPPAFPTPRAPRPEVLDGSFEVELVLAPDVPERGGRWQLQAGTSYELLYRIHNRTAASRDVTITVYMQGTAPIATSRVVIAGESSIEYPLTIRGDEPFEPATFGPLSIYVTPSGEPRIYLDTARHPLDVVAVSP